MNEQEFNLFQNDMCYLEVVAIVGGTSEEAATSIYEWSDEILHTQAYKVTFRNGKLVSKQIIEKRDYSTRSSGL